MVHPQVRCDRAQPLPTAGEKSTQSPLFSFSSLARQLSTLLRNDRSIFDRPIVGRGTPDPAPASTDCWARVS